MKARVPVSRPTRSAARAGSVRTSRHASVPLVKAIVRKSESLRSTVVPVFGSHDA
jgi:hypothetical protein